MTRLPHGEVAPEIRARLADAADPGLGPTGDARVALALLGASTEGLDPAVHAGAALAQVAATLPAGR